MRVKALFWLFAFSLFSSVAFAEPGGLASDPLREGGRAPRPGPVGLRFGQLRRRRRARAPGRGGARPHRRESPAGQPRRRPRRLHRPRLCPFPPSYTVRLIPTTGIVFPRSPAILSFTETGISGPLIYRANKTTLNSQNAATSSFRARYFFIPSIAGETRSGVGKRARTTPSSARRSNPFGPCLRRRVLRESRRGGPARP